MSEVKKVFFLQFNLASSRHWWPALPQLHLSWERLNHAAVAAAGPANSMKLKVQINCTGSTGKGLYIWILVKSSEEKRGGGMIVIARSEDWDQPWPRFVPVNTKCESARGEISEKLLRKLIAPRRLLETSNRKPLTNGNLQEPTCSTP